MKFENKILLGRSSFMMRLLSILMLCILLQGNVCADEKCHAGPRGPRGAHGPAGDPGSDFQQYACLYNNIGQTLTSGENVLFQNQISLAGITYDGTTGVFTLQPGTYSITYFSGPTGNLNLVANGGIVPNAPLGGTATIVTLANETNTLVLQAQANVALPAATPSQCSAMITIYQID